MDGQIVALVGLALTVFANVVALVWGASRMSGTVDRLDETLKEVVKSLAAEAKSNAVQDERLNHHDDRLNNHERLLAGRRLRFEEGE